MNERILELARQVWPDPNTSHVNHKKFAELIVAECAYIAARAQDENMGWDISGIIKEHFGVEE